MPQPVHVISTPDSNESQTDFFAGAVNRPSNNEIFGGGSAGACSGGVVDCANAADEVTVINTVAVAKLSECFTHVFLGIG